MKTKTKTRVLSLLMTLAMLLTSFVVVIPASAEEGWDGTVAESFANGVKYGDTGAGTKDNPYKISTPAEFAYFAKTINDAAADDSKDVTYNGLYVNITADLDFNNKPLTPIGSADKADIFRGILDGQGHTLNNVTITTDAAVCGFFTRAVGTLKNFTINFTSFTATAATSWGALIGRINAQQAITIQNVTLNGNAKVTHNGSNLGGFIGYIDSASSKTTLRVIDCTNNLNVEFYSTAFNTTRVGGVVGQIKNTAGQLTDNYFQGLVNNFVYRFTGSDAGGANNNPSVGGNNHRVGSLVGVTARAGNITEIGTVENGVVVGGGMSGHKTKLGYADNAATSYTYVGFETPAIYGNGFYAGGNAPTTISAAYTIGFEAAKVDSKYVVSIGKVDWNALPDGKKLVYNGVEKTEGVASADGSKYTFEFDYAEGKTASVVTDAWTCELKEGAKTDWFSFAASGFASGTGTEADPYIIATAGQMAYFARNSIYGPTTYEGQYFKIADGVVIDLSGKEWIPIGRNTGSCNFKGHFDGNNSTGAKVVGVTFSRWHEYSGGLGFFARLFDGSSVKNFDLSVTFGGSLKPASTMMGAMCASTHADVVVDNCNIEVATAGTASMFIAHGNGFSLGFGRLDGNTTLSNVHISGNVKFSNSYCSPFGVFYWSTGVAATLNMTNCSSDVNIEYEQSIRTTQVVRFGAVMGNFSHSGATINVTNFVAKGNYKITTNATGVRYGGLIGQAQNGTTLNLTNVFSFATLDTSAMKVAPDTTAGIVGYLSGGANTAKNVYITGTEAIGVYENSATVNGANGTTPTGIALFGLALDEKAGFVYVNNNAWSAIDKNAATVKVYYNDKELTAGTANTNANVMPFAIGEVVPGAKAKIVFTHSNGWSYTITSDEMNEMVDFAATAFAGGAGTEADPYLISTAAQLARVALVTNTPNAARVIRAGGSKFYKLTADIDVSAYEWTPIQQHHSLDFFSGTFDGDNHTISGVKLTKDTYLYTQSMFGRVTGNIKNFKVDGMTIVGGQTKGSISAVCGIVGAQYGGSLDNVHVTNLDMTVAPVAKYNPAYVGGLVGYLGAQAAVVTNSSVYGVMNIDNGPANNRYIGGVVARGRYGTVQNVVADVDMNVTTALGSKDHRTNVGGVVGSFELDKADEALTINNTVVYGDITVNHTTETGAVAVAGILGTVAPKNTVGGGVFTSTNNVYAGTITLNSPVATNVAGAVVGYVVPVNAGKTKSTITITDTLAYNMTETIGNNVQEATYAAATNLKTEADALELTTLEGARVRIAIDGATGNLDNSGIRFDSYISKEVVNALIAKGYTVTFGTVIAKESTLAAANGNWNALVDGKTKVVVEYDLTKHEYVDGDGYNFTGALIKVQEKNYKENLTAVAYMTITTAEGVSFTVYGDATTTRSIATVAERALADQKANYSDAQRAILETYLGK